MAMLHISREFRLLFLTAQNAVLSLNTSLDPTATFAKIRGHNWTPLQIILVVGNTLLAGFWVALMSTSSIYPLNLLLPVVYIAALIIPITSQFFLPATPVFAWVITYFTSRLLPPSYRPGISVSILPTLESVLYGANISDILTRFTHPALDFVAWLPYGVVHFTAPFVVAAFLWLFRQKTALRYWAYAFGYMNLTGVIVQLLFPCAPPCP